jgi:hypothetical protein
MSNQMLLIAAVGGVLLMAITHVSRQIESLSNRIDELFPGPEDDGGDERLEP